MCMHVCNFNGLARSPASQRVLTLEGKPWRHRGLTRPVKVATGEHAIQAVATPGKLAWRESTVLTRNHTESQGPMAVDKRAPIGSEGSTSDMKVPHLRFAHSNRDKDKKMDRRERERDIMGTETVVGIYCSRCDILSM